MTHKTVTFRNSRGVEKVIFETSSLDAEKAYNDAWNAIMKFMADHNYTSYYQRVSKMCKHDIEDVEWVDVGSWSEFFYIYPVSRDVVEAQFNEGLE